MSMSIAMETRFETYMRTVPTPMVFITALVRKDKLGTENLANYIISHLAKKLSDISLNYYLANFRNFILFSLYL